MDFVPVAKQCLMQWVAFTTFVPVKSSAHHSLKKISNDELRRCYIQQKGFTVNEMWQCEWWRLYKTTTNVKPHIREHFPSRRSPAAEQLLEELKEGKLFAWVHCDIEVPENLGSRFDKFPPIIKNTLLSKIDIGDLMKNICRRRMIFVSTSKNLDIQLHFKKWNTYYSSVIVLSATGTCRHRNTHFCREHSKKCFNSFVQAAVDARRKGDKNPNSNSVAEIKKFLAKSSYG